MNRSDENGTESRGRVNAVPGPSAGTAGAGCGHRIGRAGLLLAFSAAGALGAAAGAEASRTGAAIPPLRQEVYVWQRAWSDDLLGAVRQAAPRLDAITVLASEVSWRDGAPRIVRVPVDFAALASLGRPVGLALRVGPHPHDLDASASDLAGLAAECVAAARAGGLDPSELQVDFDCPESRLAAFARALAVIRRRLGAVPLTVTALPCWMARAEWGRVVAACDGFVLQVHSVEAPVADGPMTLCDPVRARRWVEQAGSAGKPFRVALPTCGYVAGFDASGRLAHLQADGSSDPASAPRTRRLLLADPVALAELVAAWSASRPPALAGVTWYRLPLPSDRLAWTWPTLDAVMRGQPPRRGAAAVVTAGADGALRVDLCNRGAVDLTGADVAAVRVVWTAGEPIGADALGGFRVRRLPNRCLVLEPGPEGALALLKAGEERAVGWLRFAQDTPGGVRACVEGVQP